MVSSGDSLSLKTPLANSSWSMRRREGSDSGSQKPARFVFQSVEYFRPMSSEMAAASSDPKIPRPTLEKNPRGSTRKRAEGFQGLADLPSAVGGVHSKQVFESTNAGHRAWEYSTRNQRSAGGASVNSAKPTSMAAAIRNVQSGARASDSQCDRCLGIHIQRTVYNWCRMQWRSVIHTYVNYHNPKSTPCPETTITATVYAIVVVRPRKSGQDPTSSDIHA